jgi:hypothetical protein
MSPFPFRRGTKRAQGRREKKKKLKQIKGRGRKEIG